MIATAATAGASIATSQVALAFRATAEVATVRAFASVAHVLVIARVVGQSRAPAAISAGPVVSAAVSAGAITTVAITCRGELPTALATRRREQNATGVATAVAACLTGPAAHTAGDNLVQLAALGEVLPVILPEVGNVELDVVPIVPLLLPADVAARGRGICPQLEKRLARRAVRQVRASVSDWATAGLAAKAATKQLAPMLTASNLRILVTPH